MPKLELDKPTKKFLLLALSLENRFWKTLFPIDVNQKTIANALGTAASSLTNWKNAGRISRSKSSDALKNLRNYISKAQISEDNKHTLYATLDKFEKEYENNKYHVYNTAKDLGISIESCQKILDKVIYAQAPLFAGMYYASEQIARDYFNDYRGIYEMLMKRRDIWIRCPLWVRYVLEINENPVIRCKLNVPRNVPITDNRRGIEYSEYDGFLVVTDYQLFWTFEKRQRHRRYDLLHLITDARGRNYQLLYGGGQDLTSCGTYLTTDQDERKSIAKGPVILQRIGAITQDIEEITTEIIHPAGRIIEGKDCDALNALLEKLMSDER